VILGLGRLGVTYRSWRVSGRKFFQEEIRILLTNYVYLWNIIRVSRRVVEGTKFKMGYSATPIRNWFFSSRQEEYSYQEERHSNDLNLSDQLTQDKKAENCGEERR